MSPDQDRTDEASLLLQEYSNCTQVFLNESQLYWTRYGMHFAMSSALVAVWTYLVGLPHSLLFNFGLSAISSAGLITAIAWLFVLQKSDALSKYWLERLQKIEKERLRQFNTFSEERHKEFFDKQRWGGKWRISRLAKSPILLFLFVWMAFLLLSILLVLSILS